MSDQVNETIPQPECDPRETVRRLRAVTRRVEAFFESQMQRMEEAMGQVEETRQEYEVARRLSAELEQKRSEWEQERQLELARLTEASRALAQAWHELEQKQREFRMEQNRTGGAPRSSTSEARSVKTENHAVDRSPTRPRVELGLFEMKQLQAQVNQHKRRGR